VGKSHFVYEITHSHRVQDWLILEAGSVSYRKATSYLPVIDLRKGYFKVHDRETHREIREKVTGKPLALDRTSSRSCPPCRPSSMCPSRYPLADARSPGAPPAPPGGRQAPPAGEPGKTRPRGLRGPTLDRCRDAGPASSSSNPPRSFAWHRRGFKLYWRWKSRTKPVSRRRLGDITVRFKRKLRVVRAHTNQFGKHPGPRGFLRRWAEHVGMTFAHPSPKASSDSRGPE
jgi:hypothetical protein